MVPFFTVDNREKKFQAKFLKFMLTKAYTYCRISACVMTQGRNLFIFGGDYYEKQNSKGIIMCNTYGVDSFYDRMRWFE